MTLLASEQFLFGDESYNMTHIVYWSLTWNDCMWTISRNSTIVAIIIIELIESIGKSK